MSMMGYTNVQLSGSFEKNAKVNSYAQVGTIFQEDPMEAEMDGEGRRRRRRL